MHVADHHAHVAVTVPTTMAISTDEKQGVRGACRNGLYLTDKPLPQEH